VFKGISKETKVGTLTALAITVLLLGYNYMIGRDNPFKGSRDFYVVYDSAQGLAESSPVMFNGFRIGQVRGLSIDDVSHKILAKVEIYSDLGIPKNSHLKIESELLGGIKLKLLIGNSKALAVEGDTLLPDYAKDVLSMVNEKVAPIAAGVDSLISNLNNLIGRASVRKTFDELPMLVNTVTMTIDNLKQMVEGLRPGVTTSVDNLAKFSNNLDLYGKSIEGGLKSFNKLAAQLDSIQITQIASSLEATVESLSALMADIKAGKGSLGKLASDEELYNNLNQAILSFKCLINDFNNYPAKYMPLSGKKNKREAIEQSSANSNCPPVKPTK
jgi:phospholipid/cholesterol/gamma-HCH transport system substrate-binding protein